MAVTVSVPAALITVEPGTGCTCEIRVANAGTSADTFQLRVQGEAADWAMVVPSKVSLAAGDETAARVIFHVPRSGSPPAGLRHFSVTVTSTTDADNYAVEEASVAIGAFIDMAAELAPPVSQGGSSEHVFRLSNRGNCEVRQAIEAISDEPSTSVTVEPAVLTVQPGGTETAIVRVAARRGLLRTPKRHGFRIIAAADGTPPVEARGVVEPAPGPPPWARFVVAVAVPVLISLIAGRSPFWSRSQHSPEDVVVDAGANTIRSGTSRVSIMLEATAPGQVDSGYRLDGVFDYRSNRGHFTVDVSRLGTPGVGGTADVINSIPVLYLRLRGASPSPLPKPWLMVTRQQLIEGAGLDRLDDSLSAAMFSAVTGIGSMAELLQGQLEAAAKDVTLEGEERLRGERVKRYHLSLDRGVLSAGVLPEVGVTIDAGTADVWVDRRGRARQIRLSVHASTSDPAASSPSATFTFTLEFFDFGVAVSAQEPARDDVVSLNELPAPPRR